MQNKTKNNGFTLVEVVLVVVVLGILAAVVIPQFTEHAGTLSKMPAPEIKTIELSLPDDFSELVDIDIINDSDWRFITYINNSGNIMTVIYDNSGKIYQKEAWTKPEKR